MTLRTSSQVVVAGALTTPSVLTPQTTETFAESCFGTQGVRLRIISTGTAPTVTVADPGYTPSSNPGTAAGLSQPATGQREVLVPRSAIDPATGVATVTFSTVTGVTYEAWRH